MTERRAFLRASGLDAFDPFGVLDVVFDCRAFQAATEAA
jgi:hypothetical protein